MKTILSTMKNNSNEIYTYIAIPLEALQHNSDQGGQSLTVAQNVIFKALPDGQQLQSVTVPENVIVRALSRNSKTGNLINAHSALSTKPVDSDKKDASQNSARMVIHNGTQVSNSLMRKSVILKSVMNKPANKSSDKGEVRYLKCKTSTFTPKSRDQKGSFKCTLCGETLTKLTSYRKHMLMHRNTKKYKCEQCSASYNLEENFVLHMALHTKGEPTCPICKRKFQRQASLKAHILIHQMEEIFTCVECLAEYEKEEDYNKHMETHKIKKQEGTSENLPLVCTLCSHTFQDASEYKQHISRHIKIKRLMMNGKRNKKRVNTNKEHQYKCEVCKKSFAKYCLLERHVRIHSGEKPFACHLCTRAFNQKGTLQIHLARHKGLKPFQCTLCPAKFCQKGNLRVHVQKTHVAPAPGEKAYKCTMCTCIFKKVSSLNAHITKAHAGEKDSDDITDVVQQLKQLEKQMDPKVTEVISDSNAKLTLSKENALELEVNSDKYVKLADSSVDGTIKRYWAKQRKVGEVLWYVCTYCSKEFKKPSDLIRHIRVHTREKPFKCKQCDQAFSLKSTLITHSSVHTVKRQFKCAICPKTFTCARTLNGHIRRHEKRSTQQYMCSSCNAVFSTLAKAQMHMDVHSVNKGLNKLEKMHIVMQQPMLETASGLLPVATPKAQNDLSQQELSKTKPHKCHYCNASFTKSVHLKRHLLIHSGERKFKCNLCSKSFYFSYALREHMKFHSGERNYRCKICGKAFVTNAILKRHVAIHSSFKPFVCPYCKKRFKTIILCRKHINVHKKQLSLQIHALDETGELAAIDGSNAMSTIDLQDALKEHPFSSTLVDGTANLELPLDNLVEEAVMPAEINSPLLLTKSNLDANKMVQINKDNLTSKILYTDENGIIISADLDSQTLSKDVQLQNSLTQPFYQSVEVPQNYLEKGVNLALMPETSHANVLNNMEDAVSGLSQDNLGEDNSYPTVLINCDDLQALTSGNLYNACLAQLKNNDPLLMSGLNEIQDPNVLLSADPTLTPMSDFQLDSQTIEMLMPFTLSTNLSTNLSLNNLAVSSNSLNNINTSFPNIILSNIEDENGINQTLELPNVNEIGKKSDTFGSKLCQTNSLQNLEIDQNVVMNLNEDPLSIQEGAILSNLLYNSNQLEVNSNIIATSSQQESTSGLQTINDVSEDMSMVCTACQEMFKSVQDYKNHVCIEKNKGENVEPTHLQQKADASIYLNVVNGDDNEIAAKSPTTDKPDKTVKYICPQCDKALTNKNALSRHIATHQESKSSLSNACTYCSKTFKKPSDLERHIRTHTGEKPFSCEMCGKSFSLKSTLESHLRTHNPLGNKDFSCAVCSSYFSSKSSLRVHMSMHTGVKPYQCSLCPEKFRTSGHRKSHMANHLKAAENKKQSQSKTSKVNSLLASIVMDTQNIIQNSRENEAQIIESTEEQNQQVVSESEKDSLTLNQAVQVIDPLFLQQQLNNALLQDNGEDLCFVQVDVNNVQSDITDAQTMMKSLLNTVSDINFTSPLYETSEKEKSDGIPQASKKIAGGTKDFPCELCNRKYSTKALLNKHKKLHIDQASFKCTKCDAAFTTAEECDNHLKIHLGYRPYFCQLCANTFSLEKNLKTHMKRIHGILFQS